MSSAPADRPPAFTYRNSELHCERVPLIALAERYNTPLYCYSVTTIRERYKAFDAAFRRVPHTICYSVKANSNLSLLKLLAKLGAGFDVVSGGELERVLAVSRAAAKKVVFSGVGKTADEIGLALRAGILLFNVESGSEMRLLAERAAKLRKRARVALRVNPDVPAETHPYIATGLQQHKFGVAMADAQRLYRQAAGVRELEVAGISVHIGSQITDAAPFGAAMRRVAQLAQRLRAAGHDIRYIDAGGGLGISYYAPDDKLPADNFPARARTYADAVIAPLRALNVHLLLEPGRSIVGPAGALLTRVLYLKENGGKKFAIVDAAMNDLIRPSLYRAYHQIVPVRQPARGEENVAYDVVGPICETGDFFARDRALPELREGDLIALLDAGAYGMSIASNYNTRPRAAEVLVEGRKLHVARRRETTADLLRTER